MVPAVWALLSLGAWVGFLSKARTRTKNDTRQAQWGVVSALVFLYWFHKTPHFQGWGDVYFFCGPNIEFCTCNMRWNTAGWIKALAISNFVLSAMLGVQRCALQFGLHGLLPGEEQVTRDAFLSIAWRLLPYYLNNWEKQWGAESSSMLFEMPHYALELLVILPCIQVLCGRMRILAVPQVNILLRAVGPDDGDEGMPGLLPADDEEGEAPPPLAPLIAQPRNPIQPPPPLPAGLQPPGGGGVQPPQDRIQPTPGGLDLDPGGVQPPDARGSRRLMVWRLYAPNLLNALWERDPKQKHVWGRLRAHTHVMVFTVLLCSLAFFNTLAIPIMLEEQVLTHPSAAPLIALGLQRLPGAATTPAHLNRSAHPATPTLNATTPTNPFPDFTTAATPQPQPHPDASSARDIGSTVAAVEHRQGACSGGSCPWPAAALDPPLDPVAEQEHGESASLDPVSEVREIEQSASSEPRSGGLAEAGEAATTTWEPQRWLAHALHLHSPPKTRRVYALITGLWTHLPAAVQAYVPLDTLLASWDHVNPGVLMMTVIGWGRPPAPPQPPLTPVPFPERSNAAGTLGGGGSGGGDSGGRVGDGGERVAQRPGTEPVWYGRLHSRVHAYSELSCPDVLPLLKSMDKHVVEVQRMRDPEHRSLLLLIESALAIMRLSCERFFLLLTVYLSFILFRDPPLPARLLIRLNHAISYTFQRTILCGFPAICILFDAGFWFSLFVSILFWGVPLVLFSQAVYRSSSRVQIKSLEPATPANVERMDGRCAICWGLMCAAAGAAVGAAGAGPGSGQHDGDDGPNSPHAQGSGPTANTAQDEPVAEEVVPGVAEGGSPNGSAAALAVGVGIACSSSAAGGSARSEESPPTAPRQADPSRTVTHSTLLSSLAAVAAASKHDPLAGTGQPTLPKLPPMDGPKAAGSPLPASGSSGSSQPGQAPTEPNANALTGQRDRATPPLFPARRVPNSSSPPDGSAAAESESAPTHPRGATLSSSSGGVVSVGGVVTDSSCNGLHGRSTVGTHAHAVQSAQRSTTPLASPVSSVPACAGPITSGDGSALAALTSLTSVAPHTAAAAAGFPVGRAAAAATAATAATAAAATAKADAAAAHAKAVASREQVSGDEEMIADAAVPAAPAAAVPAAPAAAVPAAAAAAALPAAADSSDEAAGDSEVVMPGVALPCTHAYHSACLTQWLDQCRGQRRAPTCPMCAAPIVVEVIWRFPWELLWKTLGWRGAAGAAGAVGTGGLHAGGVHGGAGAGGGAGEDDDQQQQQQQQQGEGAGGDIAWDLAGGAIDPRVGAAVDIVAAEMGMENAHVQVIGVLHFQREVQELLRGMPAILPADDMALLRPLREQQRRVVAIARDQLNRRRERQQQQQQRRAAEALEAEARAAAAAAAAEPAWTDRAAPQQHIAQDSQPATPPPAAATAAAAAAAAATAAATAAAAAAAAAAGQGPEMEDSRHPQHSPTTITTQQGSRGQQGMSRCSRKRSAVSDPGPVLGTRQQLSQQQQQPTPPVHHDTSPLPRILEGTPQAAAQSPAHSRAVQHSGSPTAAGGPSGSHTAAVAASGQQQQQQLPTRSLTDRS
ncbi:MAG: hypothetical protein WDW38_000693 [Sanguina aurantia]